MERRPIGLVGLGLVGQALASRLAAAGVDAVGYDIRQEACEAFRRQGGRTATSLPELASVVDMVVLAVFDTAGVLEVVEGEPGLLSGAHTIRCIIDCSTGSPSGLESLSARLLARGIDFVEAPLSGSSQQIAAGEGVALVGAHAQALEAARPLLTALAGQVVHVGPPGMGAKAKLATNLVLGLNRAVFAEGLAFAGRMGIAPERFLELVLATPARSDAAKVKGPLMVSGDFTPRSRIRQHHKDVALMLAAARDEGLDLPFTRIHEALLAKAMEEGRGDLDNAAIVMQLRRPS